MALKKKTFYTNISIAKNQLLNARIENRSTSQRDAMSLGVNDNGYAVWDTDIESLFMWQRDHWVRVNASLENINEWNQAYDDSVTGLTITQGASTTFTVERRNSDNLTAVYNSSYEFTQNSPSDTWVITHNLNKRPSITVLTSAGDEVEGAVTVNSLNKITITFCSPFSGRAILN